MWNFSGSTYLIIDTGIGRIIAPPCISSEVIDVVPNGNGLGWEAVEGNGEMRIVIATHWVQSLRILLIPSDWLGNLGKKLTVVTGAGEIIVSIFVLQ